ncbi:RND family efflux transporter, MFP subunit [Filimonas lacunae]|uniref:RND family efflux transporter, MFP subunit n=2 Tax=Filimonas lacunae TaxID=477680 RepID=A0A1N7R8Z9_9BACT|nr:RND family efflux transporter, MFP subunit [Filimonas lacunae]
MPCTALYALLLSSCGHSEKAPEAETRAKVAVKQIQTTGQQETLLYSGTIEADNTVSLGFTISGRVTSVLVQEGEHVHAGQLLATIETNEYENALKVSEASLEQAMDNFKRYNELHAKGSLPERDFIGAKVAQAQAEANKSAAAKRLADTKLYAPFAGIISSKAIEKGAIVAPAVTAFTVLKTDVVYARASVTESEIAKLNIGKNAQVIIPVSGDTCKGTVTIINPQADATTRTFNVKIRLANNAGKLLPGMLSDIAIHTGRQVNAITVPAEAVIRDADDITYVFVVNESNRAIRKRITTGGLTANEVLVTNGLQPGDKVVTEGQNKLKDGQAITL